MKRFASHLGSFLAGLAIGAVIVLQGCPPAPLPATPPAPPSDPPVIEAPTAAKVNAPSPAPVDVVAPEAER